MTSVEVGISSEARALMYSMGAGPKEFRIVEVGMTREQAQSNPERVSKAVQSEFESKPPKNPLELVTVYLYLTDYRYIGMYSPTDDRFMKSFEKVMGVRGFVE